MASIKCKNCGAEIDSQARFCPTCGKPYGYCSNCGAPHSYDDKVCANCGNELAAEAEPALEPIAPTPTFGDNVNINMFANNAAEPEIKGKAALDEFVEKDKKLSRGLLIATQVITIVPAVALGVMLGNMAVSGNVTPMLIGVIVALGLLIFLAFGLALARQIVDFVKVSGLKGKVRSGEIDLDGYIKRYSPNKKYKYFAFGNKNNANATAYNKLFAASYVNKTTGNFVLYVLNLVFNGLYAVSMIPVFIVYLLAIIATAGDPIVILGILFIMFAIIIGAGLVPIILSIVLTVQINKHAQTIV